MWRFCGLNSIGESRGGLLCGWEALDIFFVVLKWESRHPVIKKGCDSKQRAIHNEEFFSAARGQVLTCLKWGVVVWI